MVTITYCGTVKVKMASSGWHHASGMVIGNGVVIDVGQQQAMVNEHLRATATSAGMNVTRIPLSPRQAYVVGSVGRIFSTLIYRSVTRHCNEVFSAQKVPRRTAARLHAWQVGRAGSRFRGHAHTIAAVA